MPINAANLKWMLSGGASNSDPLLSIGGVKSSVPLSVVTLHNLFDRVTGDEAAAGVTRYRCLYFQNVDTDADGLMAPVVFYFSVRPTNGDLVTVGLSAQGKNVSATPIATENTAPAGVTFTLPITKATSTVILPGAPYLEGDYIGVWFKQVIPVGQTTSLGNTVSWVLTGDTV